MSTTNNTNQTAHPVVNEATGECANPTCPCHELAQARAPLTTGVRTRILNAIADDRRVASVTTVRAAIADVVDGNVFYQWMWDKDEDNANAVRQEFMDAVCCRIAALQRPPHSFDAALDYQRGYNDGWADAHTATLREQNADLKEMRRLAQVRREG